jgi:hypothetical protein
LQSVLLQFVEQAASRRKARLMTSDMFPPLLHAAFQYHWDGAPRCQPGARENLLLDAPISMWKSINVALPGELREALRTQGFFLFSAAARAPSVEKSQRA